MKLYFAPDTCSLACHIVLQELGLAYDLVRVNNRTKRTSEGGDFRAVNPKGYVAALMLADGQVLTEAPALLQYLADLKPEAALAPGVGSLDRVRLQEWLSFIGSEVHAGSAPLFNRSLPTFVQDIFLSRLFARFDLIEATLSARRFLMGDSFTVADAYLFAVLGWMPQLGIDLVRWPHMAVYCQRIASRQSVVAALAREADTPAVD